MCPAEVASGDESQAEVSAGEDEAMNGHGEEGDTEEARQATPAHNLGALAQVDYKRRMLTHMPCRAQCSWCVTGRGRSSQHRRAKEHEGG